jgi:two-component system, cell cycle sensor histidine kinase and response regulator CckA
MGIAVSVEATGRSPAGIGLHPNAECFQEIFAHAAIAISQIDLDGNWLHVNKRYCEMLGYSEAELLAKTLQDITHPDDWEQTHAQCQQLLAGEVCLPAVEKRYIRKDGTVFWGRLRRSLVRDRNNQPKYYVGVVEDIDEKIRAETALRGSEQLFMLAQKAAKLGAWERDLSTDTIMISGEYTNIYGLPNNPTSLKFAEWLSLIHPEDRERVQGSIQERLTRSQSVGEEFRVVWPDGTVRWLLGRGTVFRDATGRAVRVAGVNLDITERKEAEEALRQSEEVNKQIFDIIPDCIFMLDVTSDGRFKFVTLNPAEEKAIGLSSIEVAGKFVDEVLTEDVAQQVTEHYRLCLKTGGVIAYDDELNLPHGPRYFHTNLIPLRNPAGRIHRIVGCCTDLTDVKRSQEEAFTRQKLEGIGVLAGGIAHDFSNLLGGILATAEHTLMEPEIGHLVEEELQRIRTAAIRGGEIVRQLMIYGGKDKPALEVVDISLLIEEMLDLLKISLSKHAVLEMDLGKNLPLVQANAAQIWRVVMNLITNASEAIGTRDGVIRIATAWVPAGQSATDTDATRLPERDYLRLEVSDTGAGMSPEVQAKIFDPYFSTKFPGRGLGLSVVQGIIREHKGAVKFLSEPGRGTAFQIWLPCDARTAVGTPKPIAPAEAAKVGSSTGTILVVEDEGLLRMAVAKALRKKGFSVLEAGDGSTAMQLIRAHKDDIDLVLLDVTVPGTPSREVFAEALRMRPDLKVVVTSAYGEETARASFAGLQFDHFILKPFHLGKLAGLLERTLST